ncbi:MAG: Asr1405/Asl0597 family protein [Leptolyngbyaceae cyanobacterium]
MVTINCCDRWEAYFRLQDLGIACECKSYQPLKVHVASTHDAIQVWCITHRLTKSRRELASWLEACLTLN